MTERQEDILNELKSEIREEFFGEATGHDWFHIERVCSNAQHIAQYEKADLFIVTLGALLHDISDHKFVEDADNVARKRVQEILEAKGVEQGVIDEVHHIVQNCSFKGGVGENKMNSLEGLIVQDADRIDAIGAIGVARTFAFGGKVGNPIYDPNVKPTDFKSAEEYVKNRTHTINHFYEKLLKLKDGMNTETGKKMARERHQFMEDFLQQFYAEWEGKR